MSGAPPILIDEWQRHPPSWDLVRRAVDRSSHPGQFLLTSSATPAERSTHSGAGRIVRLRVRPLTLPERGVGDATVSVGELIGGRRPSLAGTSPLGLDDYVAEIVGGGFPGMRERVGRSRRAMLDGYLDRIVDTDLPELGVEIRRPGTLRRWLTAYAAATATTTSYEKIRDAATAGETQKPAKTTTIPYREALERIWVLEPLAAWAPTNSPLSRLMSSPKHHLADPGLAARLTGFGQGALLDGQGPTSIVRNGTFLGSLFESLATLSLRVFAQPAEARVYHCRTRGGEHEIDVILERDDRSVVAFEVKLSETVDDRDVQHLHWLKDRIGDLLIDAVVITTGRQAYRRADGIGVVPLGLLGP